MAFFSGEQGSVSFEKNGGSTAALTAVRGWNLDVTKEIFETTKSGDQSRSFVGGLISGSGSVSVLYTATSTDATADFINDVLTSEDNANALFELFLSEESSKKISFSGIITAMSVSAAIGEAEVISCNFSTSGTITGAI
mgnify:CR=1 FL=1|tara:strand:- start:87 stop:503 length:417 start_codon:yes stop_codon:yes gene_type:complete